MSGQWRKDAVFYHIYPLGLCGAPDQNDLNAPIENRLEKLIPWLDHVQSLGANALYLGPVFQSSSHGYDTVDYYQVDRRLGDHQTLLRISDAIHQSGMRLVLDGVFNHVGREFWAFKDVIHHEEDSQYCDWFHNLHFGERSPKGDPFTYQGWQGHFDLVKLNLSNPSVRSHLFDAVEMWFNEFNIDGLRLDAADSIELGFLRALQSFTKGLRSDFWLLGEVVHGDYREWANPETLNSVTNYECYKGLYSSLVDANYHEIAYALNRQFGDHGIYRELWLYNFVDNHDVDRVASKLGNSAHLYPLYILLFTMPGIPSIYYGSEWGIQGEKTNGSDSPLRPELKLEDMQHDAPEPNLAEVIRRLAGIHGYNDALRFGDYTEVYIADRQFAFLRSLGEQKVLVALNSAPQSVEIELPLNEDAGEMIDILNEGEKIQPTGSQLRIKLSANWGRILKYV